MNVVERRNSAGFSVESNVVYAFAGGVLEAVRKEKVEEVGVVAVVDNVNFMITGRSEREIEERMRRIEVGLKRGLEK